MNYDVIALACEQLSYRDKLRLAQLLIQTARKEEENENPETRVKSQPKKEVKAQPSNNTPKPQVATSPSNSETISYVIERISKLKPVKKKSLSNSIKAMFQFQGGISEQDLSKIINELQKRKFIKLENNNITYL